MMSKDRGYATIEQSARTKATPYLNMTKLGIVSRDYRHKYANG
jgi:hypothetical protein